jgi:hypothetical protein
MDGHTFTGYRFGIGELSADPLRTIASQIVDDLLGFHDPQKNIYTAHMTGLTISSVDLLYQTGYFMKTRPTFI